MHCSSRRVKSDHEIPTTDYDQSFVKNRQSSVDYCQSFGDLCQGLLIIYEDYYVVVEIGSCDGHARTIEA